MNLSPIILFVFNRPEHAEKTLNTLKRNVLSRESELYVFSDGPRSARDIEGTEKVRGIIDKLDGFKKITIIKKQMNLGLARSIISGVTDVISHYGKVIVVEDDLELSPYFLDYMNEALSRHEKSPRVFSIGGYSPPIETPKSYKKDSYLSYRCCTWGWATWKDRWDKVDWEVKDYNDFIKDSESIKLFNRGGEDMSQILRLQMEGEIDSWGIRWDYAHFRNNAYCFRPVRPLVNSFGNDGSGVHCASTDKYGVIINQNENFLFPDANKLEVNEEFNRRFATFYDGKKRSADSSIAEKEENAINPVLKILKRWISYTKRRL